MKMSQLKKNFTCIDSAIQSPLMVASTGSLCANLTKKHLTRRSMIAQGEAWTGQSLLLPFWVYVASRQFTPKIPPQWLPIGMALSL